MWQDAHKEETACPLPFFSDFLNLLSVYSEGRTTPRYLGVSRSLFRHLRHNVRFTWHHPSLISVCSYFMCSTSAKMQVCVWYRTVDVQFSACFLSPLLASSSYPSSGTGQLLHAPERKWALLHCWVMSIFISVILHCSSKCYGDFLFLLGIDCATPPCGISLAPKRQMNMIRLLLTEQQR